MTAYEQVQAARAARPYTTRLLINGIVTDFQELHGDRVHGDDDAVIGGIGWLDQQPLTVIATTKGATPAEHLTTHGGSPEPWGYRKALRLMQQAAKFHRPILTLIDTPGAFPGKEAEDNGQGAAIADLLLASATLPVPMIAVLVGEGGSGGALALAGGDQVWMTDHSMYAILSPEGFATILYKDVTQAAVVAEQMGLTPEALLEAHVIDRVIPDEGLAFPATLQQALIPAFAALTALPEADLLALRQARFRRY